MECKRCGSTDVKLDQDSRGIPFATCKSCGAYIKKMSTGEVIEYYESKIPEVTAEFKDALENKDKAEADKPLCKYCAERYAILEGRFGHVTKPIQAIYCPMCGRKLQPTDRDY